jgi:cell division protein ZapA (FtsZ GTPase activity inhibitor)
MDEKVEVTIAQRRLEVEIEGLTPIEIEHIAGMVSEKLEEAQSLNPKVTDTSKLAIHALLYLAAELYKVQKDDTWSNLSNRIKKNLAAVARLPRLDPEVADSYKPYICALTDLTRDLRKMMLKAEAEGKK